MGKLESTTVSNYEGTLLKLPLQQNPTGLEISSITCPYLGSPITHLFPLVHLEIPNSVAHSWNSSKYKNYQASKIHMKRNLCYL